MLRLDRWLVTLGIGSRSEVQKLVKKGGVKVNDAPVKDPGMQVDETTATLTVTKATALATAETATALTIAKAAALTTE